MSGYRQTIQRGGVAVVLAMLLVGVLALGNAQAQTFPPPILDPPPGATLTSSTVTFVGGHVSEDLEHWLSVGTTVNGKTFYDKFLGTGHTATVTGLPTSGTIYARYWSRNSSGWAYKDHMYTMNVGGGGGGSTSGLTVPPWSQIIPAAQRFVLVMGDAAVLDKETGLVWERSPDTTLRKWTDAIDHCVVREVGGRKGWSLPMREQLASLVDPSNSIPTLPTGHPFLNVSYSGPFRYWSATTDAANPVNAWSVHFYDGSVSDTSKGGLLYVWCVRGGQTFDGNTHNTLH